MPYCNDVDTGLNATWRESEQTSSWSLARDNLENRINVGKQMTAMISSLAGAPSANLDWETVDWSMAKRYVHRLQMRIAKATREGRHGKVKALQWLLTHSFYAKLLAVKRVSQNQGAKTPGVDGITWKTPNKKMQAALSLQRPSYKPQPLRRIYIPKKQKGKLRPLSIPTMLCRAQQALHLLALEPVAETKADKNSYGFRPLRSTADAIAQCFIVLSRRNSAKYVLEADIKSCFDTISHQWLLNNVPMDKSILRKWLDAGYIEKGKLYNTAHGTPQGGIISPTLLNVTLSGLEQAVKAAVSKSDKVNIIIYADDFIITGVTKEVLKRKVRPAVEAFLSDRGLNLSKEKTKITHINEGFNFLGTNIRKYNGKLIMQPAKDNVKRFIDDIRETVKRNATAKTENLIWQLNSKIRGWANYHRHVCAKKTFSYVDSSIFRSVWWWAKRRHPNKNAQWIKDRYFRIDSTRNWIFSAKYKDKEGTALYVDLAETCKTPIKRHIKIKADATPYDPVYQEYLEKRIESRKYR